MFDISAIDTVAILVFATSWLLYSVILHRMSGTGRTLSSAMDFQRRQWMRTMMHRDLRMIDTGIMSGLQNGTAFFASTSLIAIGGCFALLNAADHVYGVMRDLSLGDEVPKGLFEAKVIGLMLIFGYAFFKFGWSYRLFNYASILIGATPTAAHSSEAETIAAAERAAVFTITAGRHFNHGLRAFFFSIGYLGWFVNGWALIVTTLVVAGVQLHRQFFSDSARIVIEAARQSQP
ncbi:membrane protein [Kaistia sp. 32K]|uniref:DUF599 domain-containing protein n=1 Tax=Kaistia sp. 32K TaxID=2795690 RepID=UPI001915273D|nr:DUF599 family protein [Kaistia sp. 32K]BCP54077.1 membrane protein [Kaistia sp. 32K]